MRFVDRPSTAAEVDIAAPPEAVWALVTDINLPAKFSNEFQGADWLDGAVPVTLGARFRGRNTHHLRGDWETTSTVVACEPERAFAWAVEDPDLPVATWRFDLEPVAGGTRLRFSAAMGPGPSGITPLLESMPDQEEFIIGYRIDEWQRNMLATVEGIKGLVEP